MMKKKPIDKYEVVANILFGVLICAIVLIVLLGIFLDDEEEEACASIDGTYQVIEKRNVGKTIIDVYGCVKATE